MTYKCLLVLVLVHATLAEVSPNFGNCRGQFYDGTPPKGFKYMSSSITQICQMYKNNNPFFASLYHKKNRTPLYSAYILDIRPGNVTGVDRTFQLEPQLVDGRLPKQMMLQSQTEKAISRINLIGNPRRLIKQVQAVSSDYKGSNYHRGHLNPNADHPKGPKQKATYTLTNVAPMIAHLNRVIWRGNEKRVRDIAAKCGKMYVVTGVVPGNNWISVDGVQRVNIPSHIWSAFCCLDNNNRPIRAEGTIAPNVINPVIPLKAGLSIADLQSQLTSLLRVSVTLFRNNCS